MNPLLRIPYMTAGALARGAAYLAPRGESKAHRGLNARRGILARYRGWGESARDSARPLVWFHAPSVGEGLQAQPVMQILRTLRPEVQIAYTFYSPSAERFARSLAADFADYLPFDTFGDAKQVVAALRPRALVFSKLDIWPALTETAASLGVPVGVISATLPESSARRSALARQLLGDAYRALTRVGAIDARDAERLQEQGVRPDRISVTGDTRYDQVWARALSAPSAFVESLRSSRPTVVAGSTWPADEEHLLPAWIAVRAMLPDIRLVIAPHELTEEHLTSIRNWAEQHRLAVARVDDAGAKDADVIIVDRYGVLGDLYSLADVAFVGGGFHSAGLHSVLEPAAFGVPVLFGPRHTKSRDAYALLGSGGGAEVTNTAEIAARLLEWLTMREARAVSGTAARATVQSGLGAAERSFQLVTALLGR